MGYDWCTHVRDAQEGIVFISSPRQKNKKSLIIFYILGCGNQSFPQLCVSAPLIFFHIMNIPDVGGVCSTFMHSAPTWITLRTKWTMPYFTRVQTCGYVCVKLLLSLRGMGAEWVRMCVCVWVAVLRLIFAGRRRVSRCIELDHSLALLALRYHIEWVDVVLSSCGWKPEWGWRHMLVDIHICNHLKRMWDSRYNSWHALRSWIRRGRKLHASSALLS